MNQQEQELEELMKELDSLTGISTHTHTAVQPTLTNNEITFNDLTQTTTTGGTLIYDGTQSTWASYNGPTVVLDGTIRIGECDIDAKDLGRILSKFLEKDKQDNPEYYI